MMVVVDAGPKADIQALLDMEGSPNTVLLVRKHPNDPDEFDFGTSIAGGNIDVSPSGLPVYIMPDADRAGTFRLDITEGIITLVEEP